MPQDNERLLGEKPIFRLLMKMAVPTMLSMFIQSMYNIVDSIFVTRLGQQAFNAVTLVYPLQNLVLAVAVGLGVGLNSCISRSLGAGRRDEADSYAAHGFMLSFIHCALFLVLGLFGTKPFLKLFTDDPAVLEYGVSYGKIVLCLACFSLVHIAVEKLFQATGNTMFPMLMQALGAIVNIIFDPLLIYGVGVFPEMGVTGAAVATVLGQACACIVSLVWFFAKGNGLKVRFRGFRFRKKEVGRIYAVGVPSALMMAMPSALVGILNTILGRVSELSVNFFGIYDKLQTLIYVPASGLVQGMRPIVGYNHGANLYGRMDKCVRLSLLVVGGFILAGTLLFELFPRPILALFGADNEMMEIGIPGLRILASGFLVSTFGVILPGAFEALGMGVRSLAITLVRQLILIPPLALALLPAMGLAGVWLAFPVSECAAAALALALYAQFKKRRGAAQPSISANAS